LSVHVSIVKSAEIHPPSLSETEGAFLRSGFPKCGS
jgi:hypothetical protein